MNFGNRRRENKSTADQWSDEGELVLVFEDGIFAGSAAVDQDEAHFPVLQVQPLDNVVDMTMFRNIEGNRFCSFLKIL